VGGARLLLEPVLDPVAVRAERCALGLDGLELGEEGRALLLDATALVGDVREELLDARGRAR
jgi:hypothetical protein